MMEESHSIWETGKDVAGSTKPERTTPGILFRELQEKDNLDSAITTGLKDIEIGRAHV